MTSDVPTAPASRLVAGVATLAAVVLVAGVVVSARGADPADDETTVSAGALVLTASGEHVSRADETVPRGAQVVSRTPLHPVTLTTRRRVVTLATGTAVTVQDGVRQRVTKGSVLVAVGNGPGVTLSSPGGSLRVAAKRARVRLDTGTVLRATSYAGSASLTVPGRDVTTVVRPLFQLQLALGSAPGAPSPLHLTKDDHWERANLPEVVADDRELVGLARDFAEAGSPVAAALPARLRHPDRVVTAEHAVAYALAGDRQDDLYAAALALRARGGSWGVVARLLEADPGAVADLANGSARPDTTTTTVLADAAPDAVAVLPVLDLATSPVSGSPAPSASVPPRPRPSGAPSPAPSAGVVPQPVASLLAPVLDLLPVEVPLVPHPSPSASRKPQVPVVGPLVGGLLTPSPAQGRAH